MKYTVVDMSHIL